VEEARRNNLAAIWVAEAFEPEAPLVLAADTPAEQALAQLITCQGHCLIAADQGSAVGLVTLPDLQRGLAGAAARGQNISLIDCRRSDLVWLTMAARLDQLEDQLTPNGLRQVPVFAIPPGSVAQLPYGLPPAGLPLDRLRGIASRDGMAIALARRLQEQVSLRSEISASATGSA
jgi:hypothetical protein